MLDIEKEHLIEEPVNIWTFITDNKYLGKWTNNGELLWNYWKSFFHEFDVKDFRNVYEMLFFGAEAIGKTVASRIIFLYNLYRYMLIKDIDSYFKFLKEEKTLHFAIFNPNQKQTYISIVNMMQASEWFNNNGSFTKNMEGFYMPFNKRMTVCVNPFIPMYGPHDIFVSCLFDDYMLDNRYEDVDENVCVPYTVDLIFAKIMCQKSVVEANNSLYLYTALNQECFSKLINYFESSIDFNRRTFHLCKTDIYN